MSYRLYLDFKTNVKTIEDLTKVVNRLTETNHNYQLTLTNDYLIDRIQQTDPSNPPLIRVLEAIKHHSLELYYWPDYQLLGVPHSFTTPVQNKLIDYYDANFYFQDSTDQDYPLNTYDGFESLPFYQELVDLASTGDLEDVYDRFSNYLGINQSSQKQPLKLTVDFGVTEPTNQDLIDCQKFANQLKEKGLL
jgi:hypothetical protein